MVWCVSKAGVHEELHSHMCRCAVRQATDVPKYGMTTSGYGGEDTGKIRGVGYSSVGNEVIPFYAENTSLAYHIECLQPLCQSVSLLSTVSKFQHHEHQLPGHMQYKCLA